MEPTDDNQLSIAQCASLACLLEATTPKPGNVHRGADFEDLCFYDFVVSAVAIGPAIESAQQHGVGAAALQAIRATRSLVPTNTNLGCVLLMAPLAAVPPDQSLDAGIGAVLASLTAADAERVYEAIRIAAPGGLGHVDDMDVFDSAPGDLIEAMRLAAGRDLV
ncbi:MAG: triphosphoribosyl-dephospho-CoA synthase, partial [Planctomycetota bacterium]